MHCTAQCHSHSGDSTPPPVSLWGIVHNSLILTEHCADNRTYSAHTHGRSALHPVYAVDWVSLHAGQPAVVQAALALQASVLLLDPRTALVAWCVALIRPAKRACAAHVAQRRVVAAAATQEQA
jgi:hypothetical protein